MQDAATLRYRRPAIGAFILAPMNGTPTIDRPPLLREPIVQGLLLSAGLHLAVLALVHPMPSAEIGSTLVINARLSPLPPQPAEPQQEEESTPEVVQETPPVTPDTPPPLPAETLTVSKPAPIQQQEAPPTPVVQTPDLKTEITAKAEDTSPPTTQKEPAKVVQTPPAETAAIILPSPVDTTWYLARQVDKHPRVIGSITPKYPDPARQKGQEGSLKLMVKIDDLGQVRDVEVVEAQPPGVFDDAALEAFRNARFQPAMKDGRPVRYEAYMRVEFKLE